MPSVQRSSQAECWCQWIRMIFQAKGSRSLDAFLQGNHFGRVARRLVATVKLPP